MKLNQIEKYILYNPIIMWLAWVIFGVLLISTHNKCLLSPSPCYLEHKSGRKH